MQTDWIRRNNTDSIVVFALGWGCDSRAVEHLAAVIPEKFDIVATYDYRTTEPLSLDDYTQKYLFAWSFGVWAAEQIFTYTPTTPTNTPATTPTNASTPTPTPLNTVSTSSATFTKAVALCGSPCPVHSEYGIDPKRLGITIKGFAKRGTELFDRRVYTDSYDSAHSTRADNEKIEELIALNNNSTVAYSPSILWTKAIVGSHDEIFPTENLLNFWGIRAVVLPLPHYPFANGELILRELDI